MITNHNNGVFEFRCEDDFGILLSNFLSWNPGISVKAMTCENDTVLYWVVCEGEESVLRNSRLS